MHAPMMKAIETDMPDDIKQFSGIEESRSAGIGIIAMIRASIMKPIDEQSAIEIGPPDQVHLLEAWEDLVTRADSPDATNSKIASLEQECDRLKAEAEKYKAGNEELNFALRMSEEELSRKSAENSRLQLSVQTFQETAKKFADQSEISFNSEIRIKQENKELRKELSVLRRALNAANGVVGHFTGRK